MTQPKHVVVSNGVPREHRAVLAHLVELAAELSDAPLGDCEVHVKYGKTYYRRTTGYAYYMYNGRPFDECAHTTVRTQPGVRYLVTIRLSRGYVERYATKHARTQGIDLHYAKYKTFPHYYAHTWEEEVISLLAHEFEHIGQYERPRRPSGRAYTSELDCELAAMRVLALYRIVIGMTEKSA